MLKSQYRIQALMEKLEGMPRGEAQQYPAQVTALLQQQRQADVWAEAQYSQQPADYSTGLRALHQQSLGMVQLLLNYQARAYPLPAGAYTELDSAQLQARDTAISERFDTLMEQHPSLTEPLDRIRKEYRFVRSQLLGSKTHQSTGGIEFYVSRSVIDLDELAAQLAASSAKEVQPMSLKQPNSWRQTTHLIKRSHPKVASFIALSEATPERVVVVNYFRTVC